MLLVIIGVVGASVITGITWNANVCLVEKKYQSQMKQLESKHNWEIFSKQLEITQLNVEMAIEQCRSLRLSKDKDIELCSKALKKLDEIKNMEVDKNV